jgi:hypothetical protein
MTQFLELLELIPGWLAQARTPSGFLTVASMALVAIAVMVIALRMEAVAARKEGRVPVQCVALRRLRSATSRPMQRTAPRSRCRGVRPFTRRSSARG